MKRAILTILIVSITATALIAQKRNRFVTGDLRFHQLQSNVFGNTRMLRVLVPPDYRKGGKTYPVLYLNDGQNLFDPNTSQVSQIE